jgi:hypothetical protein
MHPLNSVDDMLDVASGMLTRAVQLGQPCPVLLVCDTPQPGGPLTAAWVPEGNPIVTAARMVREQPAPRWACLVVDAWVTLVRPGDTPARGYARAAVEQGDPDATDALIVTWVAVGCTPVTMTKPYTVQDDTVCWLPELAQDSRWQEYATAGLAVTLLQGAIDAANARA